MQINFLASADGTPLTKGYVRTDDGGVEESSYPMRRHFTSYTEEVRDPQEFAKALKQHAEQGHCLLKGNLRKALNNEPRKGQTTPTEPTQFIVLDLDFEEGWSSVDDFLRDLHEPWANVSYVWQDSSGAGIKYKQGLRGHIFLMLNRPVAPAILKTWLRERNLSVDRLNEHLSLNAVGRALKWGLDVTTCQNDKLIYVAPPVLSGIVDPIPERIKLVRKDQDFAPAPTLNTPEAAVQQTEQVAIDHLREAAGLPKTKAKTKVLGEDIILRNPDRASIVETKDAGDFVRVNLAGDNPSWGYYYRKDDPELLRNFKGEPAVRIQDIDPEFYQELTAASRRKSFGPINTFACLDNNSDNYYLVRHDTEKDRLVQCMPVSSESKIYHYLADAEVEVPDPLPTYSVEFDPTSTHPVDHENRVVNEYRAPDLARFAHRLTPAREIPPTIAKLIGSVCGNCPEAMERFVNWLACLFQTRQLLGTAWVFHGTQGTGKGLVRDEIIKPLIGKDHVLSWKTREFEDTFNEPLKRSCVLWLDEFNCNDARSNPDQIMANLKELITEPEISVRGMRVTQRKSPNFNNVIIATNWPDPIRLDPKDRRFNIAPAQYTPLTITRSEVNSIKDELPVFASYLWNYEANMDVAMKPLYNEARQMMIGASMTSVETFFHALQEGEVECFIAHTGFNIQAFAEGATAGSAEKIIHKWAKDAVNQRPTTIGLDELAMVYQTYSGKTQSQSKFASMVRIHGFHPQKQPGATQHAIRVSFQVSDPGTVNDFIQRQEQPEKLRAVQ